MIGSSNRPVFALLLDKLCDQASPTGLIGCPETCPGIAMKIFTEPVAIVVALLIERLNLYSSIVLQGSQATLLAFEALQLVSAGGFALD
jgi:hypothetical protein